MKVTMHETPTEQVLAQAVAEVNISDAAGRTITLKRPGVLAQFRLVEMLGDSAKNQTFMGMVLPMLYVSAIDGDPVRKPTVRSELDALIQRLDEDGVQAVVTGVPEHFARPDPDKDAAALKN